MSGVSTPSRRLSSTTMRVAAAQPAEGFLVQFGPDARTGTEDQQANGLAAVAQRQHEQPVRRYLPRLRIAHHRTGAVIDLRFFAGRGVDDRPRLPAAGSAQLANEALDALIAAAEAVARRPGPARSPWRCGRGSSPAR